MIFENLIQTNLRTKYLGKFIEYYQIIDSTNKEAKSLVENHKAKHGMMVITDSQKHGKGRSNNHWFMSPGKGLAMSIIYLNQLSLNRKYRYEKEKNINSSSFKYNELDELISDKGVTYNTKRYNRSSNDIFTKNSDAFNEELFEQFKQFILFQKKIQEK